MTPVSGFCFQTSALHALELSVWLEHCKYGNSALLNPYFAPAAWKGFFLSGVWFPLCRSPAAVGSGGKADVFALGLMVLMRGRRCGKVCRLTEIFRRRRPGTDRKEREELCPGRGTRQLSAVPGWNLPAVNRMWKISRHRPDHSRNARFKRSPHLRCCALSLPLSLVLKVLGFVVGGEREKREALKMRRGMIGLYLEKLQVWKVVFCSLSKFVTILAQTFHNRTLMLLCWMCLHYLYVKSCWLIAEVVFCHTYVYHRSESLTLSLQPSIHIDHFW